MRKLKAEIYINGIPDNKNSSKCLDLEISFPKKKSGTEEIFYLLGRNLVKFRWQAELDEDDNRGSMLGKMLEINSVAVDDEGEKIYFQDAPEPEQMERIFNKVAIKFNLNNYKPRIVSGSFAQSYLRNMELRKRLEAIND